MGDGIAKGIGEQLGQLGKQIATDIAKVPSQIVGLDKSGGTNETVGSGGGSKKQQGKTNQSNMQRAGGDPNKLAELERNDAIERQKQMSKARQMLQQFTQPQGQAEPSLREKIEMEEMEKRKKEIEEERKKAQSALPQTSSKRPKGDLYGKKAKQFGGEMGKNVKSQ